MKRSVVAAGAIYGLSSSVLGSQNAGPSVDELFALSLEDLRQVRALSAATGYEVNLDKAPASATVITANEWRDAGARTVTDVLAMVPGLGLSISPGALSETSIAARGLATSLDTGIVWLLDGQSVKELPNNSVAWGWQFPLAGLQQIEVVKGPGSAVFGADAFALVINLVSVPAGEQSTALAARVGTPDGTDVSVTAGGNTGSAVWSLSLEWLQADADTSRQVNADLQALVDSVMGSQASLAPGTLDKRYQVENVLANVSVGGWQLQFWHWRNRDSGTGTGAAQALDPVGYTDTWMNRLQLAYQWTFAGGGQATVRGQLQNGENSDYYVLFPPGAVLPLGADGNATFNPAAITSVALFTDGYIGAPTSETSRRSLNADWLQPLDDQHLLRLGIGVERQLFWAGEAKNFGPGVLDGSETVVDGSLTDVTGTAAVYADDSDRAFRYLLAQDEWQISDTFTAVIGARLDDYSDFGETVNPRASLQWNASTDWTVRASYGSAFRSPSFTEQNFKNNPSLTGNPELSPETLDAAEFSLQWSPTADMQWSLTTFHYHAEDLIEYAPAPGVVGMLAQNAGERKGDGEELLFAWKPTVDLRLQASFSQFDVIDGNGAAVPYVAGELWQASAEWRLNDHWRSYLGYRRMADRLRAPTDPRAPVSDYDNVDFKLSWLNLLPGWDAGLIVTNLADAEQWDPSDGTVPGDLPRPGRTVWLETRYQF